MGYGIHSNSYQGDYKRVLTVCSANMLRSPTIAHVLASAPYDYNTRSAGTSNIALIPVTDALLFWADEIVCADTFPEIETKVKTENTNDLIFIIVICYYK